MHAPGGCAQSHLLLEIENKRAPAKKNMTHQRAQKNKKGIFTFHLILLQGGLWKASLLQSQNIHAFTHFLSACQHHVTLSLLITAVCLSSFHLLDFCCIFASPSETAVQWLWYSTGVRVDSELFTIIVNLVI